MGRFVNPLITNTFVDSNVVNEIVDGTDADVQEILRLFDAEGMMLHLPCSVQRELENPNTPARVRRAAATAFLFTIQVPITEPEISRYRAAVAVAIGNAKPENVERDLFHVFEAAKYGAGYFITRDKGVLKRAAAISETLGTVVVTPADFIQAFLRGQRAMAGVT